MYYLIYNERKTELVAWTHDIIRAKLFITMGGGDKKFVVIESPYDVIEDEDGVHSIDITKKLSTINGCNGKYLATPHEYIQLSNYYYINSREYSSITTLATKSAIYASFSKNEELIRLLASIRKKDWEIDTVSWLGTHTWLRKRKIV